MAATKKKTSSGRRNTTTKRSTAKSTSSAKKSTGKNQKKEAQGPDLITVIVVLVAVVLVLVLVSKYKDEKQGGEGGTPTGTVSATGTNVPDMPTPDGRPDTPKPTATSTATKTPEATATPVATPTEVPVLSQTEALRIVNEIIWLDKYTVELLDDHLMLDGAEYYSFCVNNEKGEGLEPLLIVEKKEGTLLCYDMSGVVSSIERFPLDKTETGSDGGKTLTVEEAKTILVGYTAERLGLAKAPSEYEMTADDWTTMADGVECYGINFFEEVNGKQRFRGTFYVALDGSAVYSKDDVTGEFIERLPR